MDNNLRLYISLIKRPMAWRGLFACLFIAAFAGALSVGEARRIDIQARAPSWPETIGTVSESSIKQCEKGLRERPSVEYSYAVSGRVYGEREVLFGKLSCDTADRIKDVLQSFPVGASLKVHVNPSQPEQSYFHAAYGGQDEPSPELESLVLFVCGWIGVAVCWYRLRMAD